MSGTQRGQTNRWVFRRIERRPFVPTCDVAPGRVRGSSPFLALLIAAHAMPCAGSVTSLADLTLEQLGDIEITSVSKREQRLADVPASIYVITKEAIRRAGVNTLAEALRLAPNLQVARIDANQYAISARGFNNAIGNKLLVLIDGRTVYAPYFSGVQWDQQDVMLEDVARIEVISGPGASIWGTNAVNGVINVITKSAGDSQGWLVSAGASNVESQGALRFGAELPGMGRFRIYAKLQHHQHTDSETGAKVADASHREQIGWRADWLQAGDGLTLQGDAYRGDTDARVGSGLDFGGIKTSGENLLARWTSTLQGGSRLRVQGYYDHSRREDRFAYSPSYAIADVEAQHSLVLGEHQLDWGGGWRRSRDRVQPGLLFGFTPDRATQRWTNLFAQDAYRLRDGLNLVAGVKFEHNDYTGWEFLPNLRLAWAPSPRQLWWAAVSRAVRAPSRLDKDIRLPANPPYIIAGGPEFVSEVAHVVELGYRAQPSDELNYSMTLFRHDWDRLRSGQKPPNALVQNMIEGVSYGAESWGQWQPRDWLRLSAGLTLMRKDLRLQPGSLDPDGPRNLGNDPKVQWQLRADLQLSSRQEVEFALRRVGALPYPQVPAYTALDLNYSHSLSRELSLSVSGQNLLDRGHPEINAAPGRSEIARALFVQLKWNPNSRPGLDF